MEAVHRLVESLDEFSELALPWEALRLSSRMGGEQVTPFLSHDWLGTHLDVFERPARVRVSTIWRGEELVAAAPLVHRTCRRWSGIRLPIPGGVRVLVTPANPHTPRGGWLLGSEPARGVQDLWEAVKEQDDWDVLEVRDLPVLSQTRLRLLEALRNDGYLVGEWPSMESPYLKLPIPEPSGKFGRELRRRIRRLEQMGRAVHHRLGVDCPNDEVGETLKKMQVGLELEAAGWKGRRGTAILCDPRLAEFYRRVALSALAKGMLVLDFLYLDGQPVGFHFSLKENGKLYLLKPGFDPSLASLGPGHILLWWVARRLMDEGVVELDLLGDDVPWKREWTGRVRPHVWLHAFPPTPRGRLLYGIKYGLGERLRRFFPGRFSLSHLVGGEGKSAAEQQGG